MELVEPFQGPWSVGPREGVGPWSVGPWEGVGPWSVGPREGVGPFRDRVDEP